MLGALALGFTSLMMLSRRREQVLPVAVPELVEQSEQVTLGEEGRVSHAFDPSVQDSDRETLRIQPRIDPSHVAIVDPTMTITPTMVAATAVPSESSGQPEEALAMSRPPSEYDEFESKFKLLIAETYKELDDTAAAYELLLEVQVEGSPQQGEVASSMIELLDR